ncbi:hypothetical protein G6M01_08170 [Agrobacterium tumefaciens]|nr:hypothetical protein [Agrobacterium tumefaciens]
MDTSLQAPNRQLSEYEINRALLLLTELRAMQGETGRDKAIHIAGVIQDAVRTERNRIIEKLEEEADLLPCGEDAMVTRSNARLIKADFDYEEAERIAEMEDASA